MYKTLALLALVGTSVALHADYIESSHDLLWASFKDSYGKHYSGSDGIYRKSVHKANMLKGARLAQQNPKAQFLTSPFADLTAEEFKVYHNLNVPQRAVSVPKNYTAEQAQATRGQSKDWRQEGAVTQVKNQGQCGSCWAFSTTGGIEGAWALSGQPLTSLSEQMLVDCDTNDNGCQGGLMPNAFDFLIDNYAGQIVTEATYRYVSGRTQQSGECRKNTHISVGARIHSYRNIAQDEDELAAQLIAHGPVSIAVDATAFQMYSGGVMSYCNNQQLDHGVLAVGVTPDYWIVKNSWGPQWGESGYIRIQRGVDECLIAECASIPVVGH